MHSWVYVCVKNNNNKNKNKIKNRTVTSATISADALLTIRNQKCLNKKQNEACGSAESCTNADISAYKMVHANL